MARAFYNFCGKIAHPKGYFLQKYNPDGTVASGWHAAWDVGGRRQLVPIQEDETALVIWALWQHYDKFRDIDFVHQLYRNLVVKCADFMVEFRDEKLGLPKASWNLWEDRRGIHTFTCSTVVAGLRAAAKFARLFAENEMADIYETAANEIVTAMRTHLYSSELGRFLRGLLSYDDDQFEPDATIDASLFGIFYFGAFTANDETVIGTMRAVEGILAAGGGIARFENDGYMRTPEAATGNAWIICTLWLADYYIARAHSKKELGKALNLMKWVVDSALPSGVLAEQLNPVTGEHVSVSPLTWSHSTFIATVCNYLNKYKQFSRK
jgi:GH15 family glucan-1,4-alpha-glucosidase